MDNKILIGLLATLSVWALGISLDTRTNSKELAEEVSTLREEARSLRTRVLLKEEPRHFCSKLFTRCVEDECGPYSQSCVDACENLSKTCFDEAENIP